MFSEKFPSSPLASLFQLLVTALGLPQWKKYQEFANENNPELPVTNAEAFLAGYASGITDGLRIGQKSNSNLKESSALKEAEAILKNLKQ